MVDGAARMVYVGGQNGTDSDGNIVDGGLGAQTEQALQNLLEVLKAADATQENVVKLTIYMSQGQDINEGFAASQKIWGMHAVPLSVLIVASLGRPDALVEIEAVAAVEV